MAERDLREEPAELPVREVLPHEVLGQHGDSTLAAHAVVDRGDRPEVRVSAEAQPVAGSRGLAPVAEERQLGGDVDEDVPGGVLGPRERRPGEQRRRADEDVVLPVESHGVERAIGVRRGGHRRVDLERAHLPVQIVRGAEVEVDADPRELGRQRAELREESSSGRARGACRG